MSNWMKKASFLILLVFAISLTGCLSSGGDSGKTVIIDPDDGDGGDSENPKPEEEVGPARVYNPDGNKQPIITYFGTDDLDVAVVEQGQRVYFEAKAMDPEGMPTSIRYEASDGAISGNRWTAPTTGGLYQIRAIANDGVHDSDPEVITLRVPGKEAGFSVLNVGVGSEVAVTEKGQRRVITSASTNMGDTAVVQVGESVDITLQYSSDDQAAVSFEFSVGDGGKLEGKSIDKLGTNGIYTDVYTYTAPKTAPVGNKVTLTFTMINPSNPSDYAKASIMLLVNTPPSISKVEFITDSSTTSIEPGQTKTMEVSATEEDEGDRLTYFYEVYSGGGTLAEETNFTGQVEYTAAATSGTEEVIVIVSDTRGGSDQKRFTIVNTEPMDLVIADAGETYADVTDDNGDVEAAKNIRTSIYGTSSVQASVPRAADFDTAYSADGGIEAYASNVPDGSLSYEWTDTVKVGTEKTVGETFFANITTNTPDWGAAYPGEHEITGKAVVSTGTGTVTQSATGSIYVNEPPRITGLSFTNSNGETASIFNGTTENIIQVSPGQSMAITASIEDADNERIAADKNVPGIFADTATKFTAQLINVDDVAGTMSVDDGQARINEGSGYTNTSTVGKSSISIDYDIYPDASSGPGTFKYVLFRVKDGMDDVSDYDTASVPAITDAADADILPGNTGISKVFDAENTGLTGDAVDQGDVLIGYHPRKTNFDGRFYLEFVPTKADPTVGEWKVYNEETSAYIQDEAGDDIVVPAGDGVFDVNDSLDAPYEWLLVDVDGTADLGDKIYFRTFATQVVAKFEVLTGPKIATIVYNKYVTLGGKNTITVYGDNGEDTAYVNVRQISEDGGLIEQVTDGDGDNVDYEVWTYTAPATWPANNDRVVKAVVTLTDYNDTTLTLSREIEFYLNRNPVIGDLKATSKVDTTDGFWTKKGVESIPLAAVVTDPDINDYDDQFNYSWNLVAPNTGSMDFANSSASRWYPKNGSADLTANGGPDLDGHYPIQLTVIDTDENGLPKGGLAMKTMKIGINEDPTIVSLDLDSDKGIGTNTYQNISGISLDKSVGVYDDSKGTPWSAGDVVAQDAGDSGNMTIDFNNPAGVVGSGEYPGVKLFAYPDGVNDHPLDRNDLTYMYYMTIGTATGNPLTSEAFEYEVYTDPTTELTTRALKWEPSLDMRKNGGTYYLHFRIEDPKYGVAKGIKTETVKVEVVKDTTIADPAIDLADVTAYDTSAANQGDPYVAGLRFKAGSELEFSIPVDGSDLPRDTDQVLINIDGLIDGVFGNTVADSVLVALTRNEGTDVDDPTDDTFEGRWIAPVDTSVDTAGGIAYPGTLTGLSDFRVVDLTGNQSPDGADGLGTVIPVFSAITDIEVDYDPPVIGQLTNTTARGVNDDGTNGSVLNGNTGLDLLSAEMSGGFDDTVMKIGDRVAFNVIITDGMVAGDADALNATSVASIAYISSLVGESPLTPVGGSYPTNGTAVNDWIAEEKALSLNTVGDLEVVGATMVTTPAVTDLVLNENSNVSVWGAGANYGVWVKATDNALAQQAALAWPTNENELGNTDYTEVDFLDGQGIDLTRPTALAVDIYSYNEDALEGEIGYAPVGDRAAAIAAGNDKDGFALIDHTLFQVDDGDATTTDVDEAKAALDDGNPDTAEIVRIKFSEPLLVDQGTNSTDELLVSTLNDYSLRLYKYRDNDSALKDQVAVGIQQATVDGGHEVAELEFLKNWAYTETTNGNATDTSVVYIVIQKSQMTGTVSITNATGALTGAGTNFKDDLRVGDIIEVLDVVAGSTETYAYRVTTITDGTNAVVEAVDGKGADIAATATYTKAVDRAARASFFEVRFADYQTDAALGDGTNDGNEPLIIVTDAHGNSINAGQNNFTKDNPAVSF